MKMSKKILAAFLAALMLVSVFSFGASAATAITEANALFATPKAGEYPATSVTPENSTMYKTYLVGWYTKNDETGVYTKLPEGTLFEKGVAYYARVAFYPASSDYVFTEDAKFTINDRTTTAVPTNEIDMDDLLNSILGYVGGRLGVVVREVKYRGVADDGPTDELGTVVNFVQRIIDMIKKLINEIIALFEKDKEPVKII